MAKKKHKKKYGKYAKPPSERALAYYKGKPITAEKVIPFFLPILSLISAHFVFTSDLGIFLSIVILIPIYVVFKFDGRILAGTAIILLIIAAIILAIYNNEDAANLAAIYAYWFLVDGVVCEIIEYVREERQKASAEKVKIISKPKK